MRRADLRDQRVIHHGTRTGRPSWPYARERTRPQVLAIKLE
jgi:hypothetical protein